MSSKTIKVAIYRNTKYDFERVQEHLKSTENSADEVRTSAVVEVTLEPLPVEDVVSAQVTSLKALKVQKQAECEAGLQAIDKQISELLALPHLS